MYESLYLLVPNCSIWGEAIDCLEKGTAAGVDGREAFAKEDMGAAEKLSLKGEHRLKIWTNYILTIDGNIY